MQKFRRGIPFVDSRRFNILSHSIQKIAPKIIAAGRFAVYIMPPRTNAAIGDNSKASDGTNVKVRRGSGDYIDCGAFRR